MEKQKPGQYQQESSDATVAIPPKLEDLGITKDQSHRWQLEASVPDYLRSIFNNTLSVD